MTGHSTRTDLLVIEDVNKSNIGGEFYSAAVRVGGYPVQVVVDYSRTDKSHRVTIIQMPWLLALHAPSRTAVIDFINRFREGEVAALPADLSSLVRDGEDPFPIIPMSPERICELDRLAEFVDLEVLDFESIGTEPTKFRLTGKLHGQLMVLTGEAYASPGRLTVVRWANGTPQDQWSRIERHAIERCIARKVEK